MTQRELCEACVRYINENAIRKLTVEDVAEAVYFSKSYVQHVFKEEMGVSLMKYVHKRKMLYARERLERGDPPSKVARELGYKNYARFSVRFKKQYGVSPRKIGKESKFLQSM